MRSSDDRYLSLFKVYDDRAAASQKVWLDGAVALTTYVFLLVLDNRKYAYRTTWIYWDTGSLATSFEC